MANYLKNNHYGFAAIIMLIIITGLTAILVFSISSSIQTKKQISKDLLNSTQSYYAAESGIEDAVYREIKGMASPTGTLTLDAASVTQTLSTSGNITTVDSVSDYSSNIRKLTATLTITTTNVSFFYGVQVGEGGMVMNNNSRINGNIYSDGSIDGGTSTIITGDAVVATGMSPDGNNQYRDDYGSERDFAKSNPYTDIAMAFTPAASGNLSQVSFYIKATNPPPGDGVIELTDYNGGVPSTTFLTTAPLDASKIGTTYSWVNYSFSSPYSVTAGITYWIVLNVSSSGSKYFTIGKDSGNTDASKYKGTGSWTDESGGYAFKAWIGGVATHLNSVEVIGNARANTIEDSIIGGTAKYQTIDADSTVGGASCPNVNCIPDSDDPPVEALPLSDSNIADWETTAEGGTDLSSRCTASGTEANPIILSTGYMDCDFHPSGGSSIVLNGTVWVRGNIIFDTNTKMKLASGYGTKSGVIIADSPDPAKGKITTASNVPICGTQGYTLSPLACNTSNGTYILIISTHEGYADNAIDIGNNTNGAIYYAHNGQANVSNGGNVKEVTAKKLVLQQGAEVTYESGLASAAFTSGPGGGWAINSWNETE